MYVSFDKMLIRKREVDGKANRERDIRPRFT